jgi:redox-sensitive bicupin YhaK (pirin superfamily)
MKIEIIRDRDKYHPNMSHEESHTFSFGTYFNPRLMGFGVLKAFNIKVDMPGAPSYDHRRANTEMLIMVLEGTLSHKDETGEEVEVPAGYIQNLSAGREVRYKDGNAMGDTPVRYLEIWLLPSERFTLPAYECKPMAYKEHPDELVIVASPQGSQSAVKILQNATIYRSLLHEKKKLEYVPQSEGRGIFVTLLSGMAFIAGQTLHPNDSAMITEAEALQIAAYKDSDILLMDIPMKNW